MTDKKMKKKVDLKSYMMIIALVVIWIVLIITTDGVFIGARNLSNLLRQMSTIAILGIGMTYVLLVGNIDLSVGGFITVGGVIAAALMAWEGWSSVPAILVILVCGAAIGFFHAFVNTRLGAPAFIVTLGTQMIFKGIALGIGKGISIAPMAEFYKTIGQGYISIGICAVIAVLVYIFVVITSVRKRVRQKQFGIELQNVGMFILKLVGIALAIGVLMLIFGMYEGMPIPFMLVLVFVYILQFIAEKTRIGRQIYAVGGNRRAAFCAGINVNKTVTFTFVICSIMAAVATIITSARLNCGSAVAGDLKETDAICAAVIGGVSMNGGKGRVMGAILGALVMASLDNGMSLLNIDSFWQYIVKGAIVIIAVSLDSYSEVKKQK